MRQDLVTFILKEVMSFVDEQELLGFVKFITS